VSLERVSPELRKRRTALFALFGLPGLAIASWVSRTPDIRDLVGASTEQMGLVLLGVSVGSMTGILVATPFLGRFGARAVTTAGMTCIVLCMPVVALGAELGAAVIVAIGLCLFGLGMGGSEIAINSEGAGVERAAGISVLPAMHGCFSLGTVVGSLAGVLGNAVAVPVGIHLVLIGCLGAPILLTQPRHLSSDTGRGLTNETAGGSTSRPLWRDRRLHLVGVVVLAMALAEGAATDWLPLVMVDGHGASAVVGAYVFAVFSSAMAIGRFSGGWFLRRYSRASVVKVSAVMAAVGIGLVVLVDSQVVASAGVLLWGLGLSLGFPLAISAAGDSGDDSAARVTVVATMGYAAFLVGPPLLGFIGEEHGLRTALLVPLALVVVAAVLSPALTSRPSVAPERAL
jgi:MFS family permease